MSTQNSPVRLFLKRINFSLYRNNENTRYPVTVDKQSRSIVLYDHACALCREEMLRLKQRDKDGKLILIDINSQDFDGYAGRVSRNAAAAALQVLASNHEWLIGMPAIRHVYAQVGLGWLMAPTGWPLISPISDLAYRYFAPNRFLISRWLGVRRDSANCSDEVCNQTQSDREG